MPQYFEETEPEPEAQPAEVNVVTGILTFIQRLTAPGGIRKYWKV